MKNLQLILFSFFLLMFCGKKTDVVEITFWAHGGVPNLTTWAKQRIVEFNQTYPDIKAIYSQKSWNMIRELLYTNFSTGTGPDVIRVHANYAAEFGEAGHYYPINKFPDFEEVKSWYEPNLFEAVRYKDNYYGLPGSALAFVLVCNKDMFDIDGLKPPKTWSEFREVAKKLTRDTNGDGKIDQWGLVLLGGDRGGFSYRLAPFWFKAGVEVLSEDLTKVIFNSPRAIEAVKLFADMYQIDKSITPGFLAYTLSEINDLFCSNKVAMSIEGPWFSSMVEEKSPGKQFYTVPVPVPDDMIDQYDTAPTLQDMVMIAISAHSKHLDAAWELTKYLRNEEADIVWAQKDMGGYPTTLKALDNPEMKNFRGGEVYQHELQHAKPWPPHPKIIAIVRNLIAPYGQKGIIGEVTPQQALDMAAKEAQAMIYGKK
ncbi:MAG: ABC transporter substrate-binding protein [bacterium]|nr:MAG: ABC transporter substrate-binding protein [bacterium]